MSIPALSNVVWWVLVMWEQDEGGNISGRDASISSLRSPAVFVDSLGHS